MCGETARKDKTTDTRPRRGLAASAAVWLLKIPVYGYRAVISPLTPPSCRFEPTCSAYALEALDVHGPVKGLWLALRRLSRCHPVPWLGGRSGYDPVPPRAQKGKAMTVRDRSN